VRLAIVIVCAWIEIANAQPTNEAETLFQDGLALFEAGKFDEACAKFELSIKKNPRALGTLMNLGRCNERRGKVATALGLYQEAFDRAGEAGANAARDKAQERIAVLLGQVPVVMLKRKGPPLDGEQLVIGDKVIAPGKTEVQLDPGTHTITLTAPGRLPFQTTVLAAAAKRVEVELPVLEVPKPKTVVRVRSSRRVGGKVTVIGGLTLIVAGSALATYAKLDYDKQLDTNCNVDQPINGMPSCNAKGQARIERDRSLGTVATVFGGAGLVATAVGSYLWFSARGAERTTTVVPGAAPGGATVLLIRRF
jgi:tetratricopeptide (TPR) repeat protein